MDQKQVLSNEALVYLKHQQHDLYLTSDSNQLLIKQRKSSIFSKTNPKFKETLKQLVWGSDSKQCQNHLWEIIKCSSLVEKRVTKLDLNTTQLWKDDFVFLKHYASQAYLIGINEEYAFCTKKEDLLSYGIFIIKMVNTPKRNSISNNDVIRLFNVRAQANLLSKFKTYSKTTDPNSQFYKIQLDNTPDFWTIELAQGNPIPEKLRPTKPIRHEDRVIIRSSETGGSLHSHPRTYKHGGGEVTWWTHFPRDQNDWWILIAESTTVLPRKCNISLIHVNTKKFLTYASKWDNVCTTSGDCNIFEWQIQKLETEDQSENLGIEQTFLIKHIPTNKFLYQTQNRGQITTSQLIVGLSSEINEYCIWQVEQSDSIFI